MSQCGFKLSIGDFGTGYSSLAYLKSLPVDELKIVHSTVDLAHNLGLTVVAEGVEHALLWDKLKALQCDEVQGYFMSKPITAHTFAAWNAKQEQLA